MHSLEQVFNLQKRLAKLLDDRYRTALLRKISQLRWSDLNVGSRLSKKISRQAFEMAA